MRSKVSFLLGFLTLVLFSFFGTVQASTPDYQTVNTEQTDIQAFDFTQSPNSIVLEVPSPNSIVLEVPSSQSFQFDFDVSPDVSNASQNTTNKNESRCFIHYASQATNLTDRRSCDKNVNYDYTNPLQNAICLNYSSTLTGIDIDRSCGFDLTYVQNYKSPASTDILPPLIC